MCTCRLPDSRRTPARRIGRPPAPDGLPIGIPRQPPGRLVERGGRSKRGRFASCRRSSHPPPTGSFAIGEDLAPTGGFILHNPPADALAAASPAGRYGFGPTERPPVL